MGSKKTRPYYVRIVPSEGETKKVPNNGPYGWYEVRGVNLHAAKDEFLRQFRNTKYSDEITVTNKDLVTETRLPLFHKSHTFGDLNR